MICIALGCWVFATNDEFSPFVILLSNEGSRAFISRNALLFAAAQCPHHDQ
jgi:hypothetical protein